MDLSGIITMLINMLKLNDLSSRINSIEFNLREFCGPPQAQCPCHGRLCWPTPCVQVCMLSLSDGTLIQWSMWRSGPHPVESCTFSPCEVVRSGPWKSHGCHGCLKFQETCPVPKDEPVPLFAEV